MMASEAAQRRRSLISPPRANDLSPDLRRSLGDISASLPGLSVPIIAAIEALPGKLLAGFEHPLSDAFVAANGAAGPPAHVRQEQQILTFLAESPLDVPDFEFFADRVLRGASTGLGRDIALRSRDVGLHVNATGALVLFPPPAEIPQQLMCIHGVVRAETDPLLRAIAALAMVLNLHPFEDGNGRLARMIFNHLIVKAGYPGYFPLSTIIARSRGGFELALRSLEIRSDWAPIISYIAAALTIQAR